MKVSDVLKQKRKPLLTTSVSATLWDVMSILIDNRIGCLPVVDSKGRVVGIISDTDIFRSIYRNKGDFEGLSVGDMMTKKVIVGVPDDEMDYIGSVMERNQIRHVPIMDDDKLLGVITISDMAKIRYKNVMTENRYLRMYMDGNYPG